ncbi:ZIP family metal transporter [Dactylosporangium sp. NPDC049140]|uniref:ZIP family metal transporter n=1 Tax=Dactylosporangium sp. NPDC049140 TaxID=3155647 RepID=UPI0033EAB158
MSATNIALLGAIAGFTIFLGLPVGRLRNPAPRLRALLNAGAVGILLFLLWDVLAHAWEPVDAALSQQDYAPAAGNGLVLATGIGFGLLGLVYFDRWVARRGAGRQAPPTATPGSDTADVGVPAGEVADVTGLRSSAGQLALLIAVGIGLHNFAEGLAIGNSAASGEIALAVLLIIGFGLHNATEGFGIVAPLAAAGARPSWGRLAVLGLIGGGPTLLGTLVGQRFTNDTVSIAFLALAAGSILYVVIELLAVGRRMAAKDITTWGLLIGLLAGFLTDAFVTAAGA